ncbi:hypothetical protein ACFLQN_00755 [Candidatus Aenigmatarchaeota archaeon]
MPKYELVARGAVREQRIRALWKQGNSRYAHFLEGLTPGTHYTRDQIAIGVAIGFQEYPGEKKPIPSEFTQRAIRKGDLRIVN